MAEPPERPSPQSLTAQVKATARSIVGIVRGWIPILLGTGTFLTLFVEWQSLTGLKEWAITMLDYMDKCFRWPAQVLLDPWVPWLVSLVDSVLPWDLILPTDWRNLFVLLTLYLSSHVKEAYATNVPNKRRALLWRTASVFLGLICAMIIAALLSGTGDTRLRIAVIASATGIAVYRVGFAFQFAYDRSLVPISPHLFRREFARKAFVSFYLLLGAAIVAIAVPQGVTRWDFFWVMLLAACLGFFHLVLAWRSPGTTGNLNIGKRIT